MNRLPKLRRDQRGAVVVEFAVVGALLVVLVFGIIEFGFLWLQSHYLVNSAREGARVAAKQESSADRQAAAEEAVQEYLREFFLYGDKVDDCCNNNDFLHIDVEADDQPGQDVKIDNPDDPLPTPIPAVRVTVTARTEEIYTPILWNLLELLPGVNLGEVEEVTQSAIFALQQ